MRVGVNGCTKISIMGEGERGVVACSRVFALTNATNKKKRNEKKKKRIQIHLVVVYLFFS